MSEPVEIVLMVHDDLSDMWLENISARHGIKSSKAVPFIRVSDIDKLLAERNE